MPWLILLVIVVVFCKERESARSLREARRLLRQFGADDWRPSPEPPSPHQLLGDVARPLRRAGATAIGAAPSRIAKLPAVAPGRQPLPIHFKTYVAQAATARGDAGHARTGLDRQAGRRQTSP